MSQEGLTAAESFLEATTPEQAHEHALKTSNIYDQYLEDLFVVHRVLSVLRPVWHLQTLPAHMIPTLRVHLK